MKRKIDFKKWFRLNGLGLGVLLLSLLLVACGGETALTAPASPSPGATTAAAATTLAPTVAATETVSGGSVTPAGLPTTTAGATTSAVTVIDSNLKGELTIWEALPDNQASVIKDQAATFGKAYPGVKATVLHFEPDELVYQVQDGAGSGKLPDLILASADFVTDFNAAKALQPADKLFDSSFLSGFADNAMAGSKVDGTQWGVAYTYSGTPVMLYNKKMVPTAPTTWDELGKVVRPLYDAKTKSIGLAMEINEPYILTSLLGGFGGAVLDSKNQPTLDTPQMVSALGYVQTLLKDKTVRDESRLKDNQIDYAFRDGRLGVYIGGDWLINQYASAINTTDPAAKLDLGIAPLPKIDSTGQYPVPFSDSKTFFFGAKSSGNNLTAAKTFVQWMAKPDQQASILTKLKLLPATKAFLASDTVKSNPVWSGLLQQLDLGKPQPPAIEMQAVSDALRPSLEAVVANTMKPADAAKQMQQTVLEDVAKLAVK
jgi:arabinogalactan oligomer/maltooligosaccharide transport system substrate-binding protein